MGLFDLIDTTPQPRSFNDVRYGRNPTRETRGRLWWTDGRVIRVDFMDWDAISEEVLPWSN